MRVDQVLYTLRPMAAASLPACHRAWLCTRVRSVCATRRAWATVWPVTLRMRLMISRWLSPRIVACAISFCSLRRMAGFCPMFW